MKKSQAKTSKRRIVTSMALLTVAVLSVVSFSILPQHAQADRFDEEIQALRNENANNRNAVSDLQSQAENYQDAISRLQNDINNLQSQINDSQAKQVALQGKIDENQRELERQRKVLGENIKVMYVDGQITTIEMLATSKNLSEFVDKEEYHTAVENKIQDTLKRIAKLQNELKEQKVKVEGLLADQKRQQEQIAANKAEQNRLLSMNVQQQGEFNAKIKDNSGRIAKLQEEQIAANVRLFGGSVRGVAGGGGYPYGDARCMRAGAADPPCGQYDWGYPGSLFDQWGYGYRNCTSWVAFKLASAGKTGFSNLGNATDWPGNVPSSWVSRGGGARVGDAAVRQSGTYGHVMYVERVEGNTVWVSDYNRQGDGYYRSADMGGSAVSQSGLVFIHFP